MHGNCIDVKLTTLTSLITKFTFTVMFKVYIDVVGMKNLLSWMNLEAEYHSLLVVLFPLFVASCVFNKIYLRSEIIFQIHCLGL